MRVMLVTATGGGLSQLVSLRAWWGRHDRHWVTVEEPYARAALAGEEVTWAYGPDRRGRGHTVRNTVLALRLLRVERPDVVVATGGRLAASYLLAARLLGIRSAYLEAVDRIDAPTPAGRLCYPLADVVCTQRAAQEALYPAAVTIGTAL
ncbi:UDP-N-acetylglucosamine--LPS N-acetylglucosamine transferase [Promicromonospora sp. MS192]|uniref:UDP-N-acetylglucosamine--LPS N-acetylglucosamine transferase n=1 Tax=Promicromonospora sp. MS192 TaxID=3412684 RepID=UPI003C3083F7